MSLKEKLSSTLTWKKILLIAASILGVFKGISEISGYTLKDILGQEEKLKVPISEKNKDSAIIQVNTKGNSSPAVYSSGGTVEINYENTDEDLDSTKNN